MNKFSLTIILFCVSIANIVAQQEPIKIEGETQGTTYHITYYDQQNRDLQTDIEKILSDFDMSVSTYNTNSIISRINANEKNVEVNKYFIDCFNKGIEVWKNSNAISIVLTEWFW